MPNCRGSPLLNSKCGEVMALRQYYIAHPFDYIDGKNAALATWVTIKGIQDLLNACSGPVFFYAASLQT